MRPYNDQPHTEPNEDNDVVPSKLYYLYACAVLVIFMIGLVTLHTYKTPSKDLSTYYFKDLPVDERQRNSCYDWSKTQVVSIAFLPSTSEMITMRAANGEILFLTYAESGVEQEISVSLPIELDYLYIESQEGVEELSLSREPGEEIALSF